MKQEKKESWFRNQVFENERTLVRYTNKIILILEPSKEVVQDSFLKLWANKFPNSTDNYPVAWLYKVCRNGAIDFLRKNKGVDSLEDESELLGTPCLNEQLLDSSLILKTISKLPKRTQEVLVLKFQEDLSYKEIAEVTGLTVSNVGYLIHEGIRKLRDILKLKGEV